MTTATGRCRATTRDLDGEILVLAVDDGAVQWVNLNTRGLIGKLPHSTSVEALVFSEHTDTMP